MPITKKPKSVEIFFGTLFSVRGLGEERKKVGVIIDVGEEEANVGEGSFFHIGSVVEDRDGNRMIEVYGTGGPETFGEIVGQMSFEEIIEAAKRGDRSRRHKFTDEEWRTAFQESACKGSRRLRLDC